MNWTRQLVVLMAVALFVCSVPAIAQEKAAADNDSQAALKAELDALKKELQAIRGDLKVILTELKAIKSSQKQAPRKKRERPAMKLLGQTASKHTFPTTADQEMTIGGESDRVKVVMFYASWCGFCKRALPGFEKLHKEYKDKGVDVMAINLDGREGKRGKTEQQILDHYKSLNLTLPLHMDPKSEIGRQYKVSSFPTSFVIGKNGIIEAVHVGGPVDLDKQIAGEVDKLLAGKSLVKKAAPVQIKKVEKDGMPVIEKKNE